MSGCFITDNHHDSPHHHCCCPILAAAAAAATTSVRSLNHDDHEALKGYNAIYEPEPSSSVTHYVIDKLSHPDCRIETLLKTREFTEIRIRYAETPPLTFKLYPNQLLLNQDWYYNSLIKGILQKPTRYVAFDEGTFTSTANGNRLSSSMSSSAADPSNTMKPLNKSSVHTSSSPINFAYGSSGAPSSANCVTTTSTQRRSSFTYGGCATAVEDMSINSFQSYDTVNVVDSPNLVRNAAADSTTTTTAQHVQHYQHHTGRLHTSTPNNTNVPSPTSRGVKTNVPRAYSFGTPNSAVVAGVMPTTSETDDSDGCGCETAFATGESDAVLSPIHDDGVVAAAVEDDVAAAASAAAEATAAEATAVKRYRKMFELVQKHASNLRLLKYLCDDARAKLDLVNKENIKRSGVEALDAADLKLIFSQLPQLEEVHRDLLHALREAIGWNGNEPAGWNENSTCIGRLFLNFLPETEKVYARFCSQVEVMRERIRAAEMRSPLFHAHLKFITLDRKVLPDLLVEVFQYLPQTTMILADLERYTPDEHPDKADLVAAVEKVRAVAANANEFHKQISSHMRTMNFLNRIDKLPAELIAHHRTPICDVEVREVYPGQFVAQNARLAFFLFPDGLEVAKKRKMNTPAAAGGRLLAESVAAVGATLSRTGGAAFAANLAAAAASANAAAGGSGDQQVSSRKPYKHIAWIPLRCIYLMHLVVADTVAAKNPYSFIGGGDNYYADYYDDLGSSSQVGSREEGSSDDNDDDSVGNSIDASQQLPPNSAYLRRRRHTADFSPNSNPITPPNYGSNRRRPRRSSSLDIDDDKMPVHNTERRPSVVSSSSIAERDESEAMSLGSDSSAIAQVANKTAATSMGHEEITTDDDDVYEEAEEQTSTSSNTNNRHNMRSGVKFSNASATVLACVTEEEDDEHDGDENNNNEGCESDTRMETASTDPQQVPRSLTRTWSQKSSTASVEGAASLSSSVVPLVPIVTEEQKKSAKIFSINIAMGDPGSDKSLNGQYYFEFVPKLSSFVDAAEIHNPYQFLQKLAQQVCQQTQNRHTVDELILTTLESTHAHAQKYHQASMTGGAVSKSSSSVLGKAQKKLSRALSFTRHKKTAGSGVTLSSSSTHLSSLTKSISSNNSGSLMSGNYAVGESTNSNYAGAGDGTLKRVGSNSSLVFSPFTSKRRYNTLVGSVGGGASGTLTPTPHRASYKYHSQSTSQYEVSTRNGTSQPQNPAEPTTMSVDSMSMSSALSGISGNSTVSLGPQYHHQHHYNRDGAQRVGGGGGGNRSLFGTIRDSVRLKFGKPSGGNSKPLAHELFQSPLARRTAAAASLSGSGVTEDDGVVCDNDSIMSGSFKSAIDVAQQQQQAPSSKSGLGKFGFLQHSNKHSRKKRSGSVGKELESGDGDNVSIRTCL